MRNYNYSGGYQELIRCGMLRVPFRATLQLTPRCNNNCIHCHVRVADEPEQRQREEPSRFFLEKIDEARALGTRHWSVTGGEPLLHDDFIPIYRHLWQKIPGQHKKFLSVSTNGSLITDAHAKLFSRYPCGLIISVYGSSPEVHDRVTRRPGSFIETMRGIRLLRQAGVQFMLQTMPIRENFHDFAATMALLEQYSAELKLGGAFLLKRSVDRDPERNRLIVSQRLRPEEIVELSPVSCEYYDGFSPKPSACAAESGKDFFVCGRDKFCIDAFGTYSVCRYIKTPELTRSLKEYSLRECFYRFVPELEQSVAIHQTCAECKDKLFCFKCPAVSLLENGALSAPSGYFCEMARERRREYENRRAGAADAAGIRPGDERA